MRKKGFARESPRILHFKFSLHCVESLITKNLKRYSFYGQRIVSCNSNHKLLRLVFLAISVKKYQPQQRLPVALLLASSPMKPYCTTFRFAEIRGQIKGKSNCL